jgi:hypothetical protein
MTYGDVLDWIEPTMIPVIDREYARLKRERKIDRNGWVSANAERSNPSPERP